MHAGTHDASHFLIWRLLRWEGGDGMDHLEIVLDM